MALPELSMVLTPVKVRSGRAVAIAVDYDVSGAAKQGVPLALEFNSLSPSLLRVTDKVHRLRVRDASGSLALDRPTQSEQNGETLQVWRSKRPPVGTVNVSYVVPVALAITTKRGPHIDLQAAGGGLSGAFGGFALVPRLTGRFRLNLRWRLGVGEHATSTYGDGDWSVTTEMESFNNALFLAGPVVDVPAPPPATGFGVHALGLSAHQISALAGWARRAYDAERNAFNSPADVPFRFLIRSYAGGPIPSGRANRSSFMLYLPAGFDPADASLHDLTAHEMVHVFTEGLDSGGEAADWYVEGIADYFKALIPNSAGLYTNGQYQEVVNGIAASYYTNALRSSSNVQATAAMWSGRNAWIMPYSRGALYFANLDASLRIHNEKVTVLDLVNEVTTRIRRGEPKTEATWRAVLRRRVGPWAQDDLDRMLSGALIRPAPGAFGPCMRATPIQTGVFDLGFRSPIRLIAGARIGGLDLSSAAARAGLRERDRVVESVDINPAVKSFDAPITIRVQRAKAVIPITYKPRAGSVEAFRWGRATGCPH